MKFKPTKKSGRVIVEFGPRESQLPEPQPAPPVFKLKKLLVPVDFSACSGKALEYAVALARQFDAELALLHVVHTYTPTAEMGPFDVETVQEAVEQLTALRDTAPHEFKCHTLVRTGVPDIEIVAVAQEMDIDLIVISTSGRTGLARMLLGSTTELVLRHAHCPVLVVREQQHDFLTEKAAENAAASASKNSAQDAAAAPARQSSGFCRRSWNALLQAFGGQSARESSPTSKPNSQDSTRTPLN